MGIHPKKQPGIAISLHLANNCEMISKLKVSELGSQGDGISRSTRGVVFVDRGLPGDLVKARLHTSHNGKTLGEILEILEPSSLRQDAPCPHFNVCGNCTFQHLKETAYRQWKTDRVKEAFAKEKVNVKEWLLPTFVGEGKRRRVTFSLSKKEGAAVMGYYRRRSRQISEIDTCLIADPKLLQLKERLKPLLAPLLKNNQSIDIFLQLVGENIELVLTGPLSQKGRPDKKTRELLSTLTETLSLSRVSWRVEPDSPFEIIKQQGNLEILFGPLRVHLPPAAFLQPTAEGEIAMRETLMRELPKKGKFADLFSGCGTFTGPMLTRGEVEAYESSLPATQALIHAGKTHPLKVFCRDLFRYPLRKEELNAFDAVVFDPPRLGCEKQALIMANCQVPLLIGISCNPNTFARDAKLLQRGGYHLKTMQIIDQFTWSHHIECVGIFQKH